MQNIFYQKQTKDLDALFISSPENIGYLSDFWGSFGRIILCKSGEKITKILISDSRYSESAKIICEKNNFEYIEISQKKSFWTDICIKYNITKLGIESEKITLAQFSSMKKSFKNIELIETKGIIEKLRLIKSEQEIQYLSVAAEIGDACLKQTVENFKENITEKQLAWIFEKHAKEILEVEDLSFDVIVAFGEHSSIAHHSPTDKKLEKNMPILIDCGVKYKKYCSDLTRCFWFGEQKGEKFEEWKSVYKKVHEAQKLGIEQMTIGNNISESDSSARKYFSSDTKYFIHTFGHGVGIDIHESPTISERNKKQKYEINMVVTAEPGLYFSGKFGIRIEDLLVVKENGAEFLSKSEYFLV